MECYFDNSATTQINREVLELMNKIQYEDYGNPSSLHNRGVVAERHIKASNEILCRIMKCKPTELIYTSGGTESNNLALIGGAMANKRNGMHIISTRIEHASVYNPLLFLEKQGFEITFLSVDETGVVDLEELKNAIRPDTIIVSIMHVNNEIGTIEPIEQITKLVRAANPNTIIHVDAIQSFGKLSIVPKKMDIDMLSVSGHKLHGPKGSGFLYVKEKTKVLPIIYGGGQQKDMRSGTENVSGIAGLAKAAELIYRDGFSEKVEKLYELKNYFISRLSEIEGVTVNGAVDTAEEHKAAPHIISASFEKVRAEVLLHALEEKEIYVSTGSACSSNHPAISGTLKAIGVQENLLDSTVRFSLCYENTKEQVDYCIEVLKQLIPQLRKFTRY